MSDRSTCLDRLRLECLDIRTQVEQSATGDRHGNASDDVHGSASDEGSAVGLDEDVAAHLTDSHTDCLVDISQLCATSAAADTPDVQRGKNVAFFVYTVSIKKLDPCLTAIFPCGPGLPVARMSPFWISLELRMMEVVSGDNWSYKTCKAPVKTSPPTNPAFYRPDALPVAQTTVS